MTARLEQLWAQLVDFFRAQPPARRIVLIATGVGSLTAVLALAWWVQRPLYRPLFTNLAEQDASAIVEALRAEKVPFRLEDGGRAILVPAERLYELRLALASRGLPGGGGVGFELFDRQTLGQTDFLQRLNYQRALQGELARTISRLGGVESARVHLALPERSLLVGEGRRPSASVVVKLAPGRALSAAQIDGIVHLVAASVEGLAADGVTVVGEGGRMLTTDRRGGETLGDSSGALEMQASIERQLAERVESMLAAVVGREKAIARVAATLDLARVERTEETYDPERTALRTQRTTREQERRDESQSYEVSKVVSHTVAPAGVVKQLSVAVLIDGTYTGAGAARKFTPRPAEELDRLKELVKNAVGFSEPRGDRIELTSVPFQTEPWTSGESVLAALGTWLPALLMRLLAVGLVAAGLFYVVRPLVLGLAARGGEGRTALPEATAAIARLRSIPRAQAAVVHEEAWRRLTEREGLLIDGERFARQMIAAALTGAREERTAGRAGQGGGEFLAASLDPVAPAALAQVLGREHPQVIALVLANLRARKAAEVLAALPEGLQPEIAERIADLQSVPEDLLADVGDVLAGQVQGLGRAAPRTGSLGAKLAADILNVADETVEARIFAHLEAHAPEVAEAIRGLMLTFEDLLRLDERGMQALLKEIARDDLMLALKTASPAMREKLFGNLAQRTAEILQEDMGLMGPVRLKDVEQAQARIVAAARRLDAEQRITLGARESDVVV